MTSASTPLRGRDDARGGSIAPILVAASNPGDQELLDAMPIAAGIFTLNAGKLWVQALNRRFFALAGCDGSAETFQELFHRYGAGPGGDFLRAFLKRPAEARDELDLVEGEGLGRRFLKLKAAPLPPAPGGVARCMLSVVDRTIEVQAENNLRAEMLRDSLTGLPNRLGFTEMIGEAGERPVGAIGADGTVRPVGHAVLVVDMLRFSRINESMGSLFGDELLITFARRLVSALRAGDRLARTGGNEFGVIVTLRRGIDDALKAAERIQDVLAAPFTLADLEIKVECAIGAAMMSEGADPEELFRSAQFAVKQAKALGAPQLYKPEEASLARRRFSIETELRRALDKDELTLSYQPLVDLQSGRVSGFEALARWNHADRGEISPTEFIPVAEESGLILHLGRWAMDRAARTLADWDLAEGSPLPVRLGVNLSAIQIARDDIAEVVGSALRSSGLSGDRLTLELTESSIVQDPQRAQRVFEALKALDAMVAMDDFGTGYSSLAYLQRLPIDVLKIDRSFVTGMMGDADSVAIVRAVLSLADALGMSTTAEGVESIELATTLAALGCVSGQGYYFARPLEADAALDFFRSRQRPA
ncbi:putative bifunctional diguanylate cyclase/phosphodiesterase [Sphingomonas mesophila]|uniref:putative bifunctional diguanylate cyclase/phosphodiesterase n=1 Tax=Sphingomonas mesophila TaxID=2303576 RepID=UPI000E5736F8|nr:bifunctional diguanylate cyclase/phosphodiesterase [Sphingomonas mesophila]